MAKRFIDTDLFKDPFIRSLEAPLKLLFVYIFCDCNTAGIWNVELDVAKLRCGIKSDYPEDEIIATFSKKIVLLNEGEKWFIPTFLKIQYNNELKEKNPATKKVIEELNFYGFLTEKEAGIFVLKQSPFKAPSKPLLKKKEGSKDMDKDKEEDKDKEKEKKKPLQNQKIIYPWESENFKSVWQNWKDYKQKQFAFRYKAIETEQAALIKLSEIAKGNEQTALAIMKESMAQGWKGFFELKNNVKNENNKTDNIYSDDFYARNGISPPARDRQ